MEHFSNSTKIFIPLWCFKVIYFLCQAFSFMLQMLHDQISFRLSVLRKRLIVSLLLERIQYNEVARDRLKHNLHVLFLFHWWLFSLSICCMPAISLYNLPHAEGNSIEYTNHIRYKQTPYILCKSLVSNNADFYMITEIKAENGRLSQWEIQNWAAKITYTNLNISSLENSWTLSYSLHYQMI